MLLLLQHFMVCNIFISIINDYRNSMAVKAFFNYLHFYIWIVVTGLAWLIRFRILTVNGLVFQTQVAYLIPIFGIVFGYFLMDEIITWRVLVSLIIIILGIYIVKIIKV